MDIFSGSDLVQQRAHKSPLSPTTSSLSLFSCVGAAHTCEATCSHGPYGGYGACLRIKNCCKCKITRHALMQLSTRSPPYIPYDAPMPHVCKQVLNMCPIETMNIVVLLLSLGQNLSTDKRPCMVGRNQYGYITPAFSGSPWWGEINLEKSGCGGNEQKSVKRGGNG